MKARTSFRERKRFLENGACACPPISLLLSVPLSCQTFQQKGCEHCGLMSSQGCTFVILGPENYPGYLWVGDVISAKTQSGCFSQVGTYNAGAVRPTMTHPPKVTLHYASCVGLLIKLSVSLSPRGIPSVYDTVS
jgi:hypothetical protein